ncbi:helix-turn-helix domain-containing protein [Aerococcaceae bacterium WGS1372]
MVYQPSYYSIIPATVRYDKELKANEKLLYGEITALSQAQGYCWASNSYFANLYHVSKETVSRWISKLEKKGYISTKVVYFENSRQIDKRYIYISDIPIDKRTNRSQENNQEGMDENIKNPIEEKVKENITRINNTRINNSTSSDDDLEIQNMDRDKYKKVYNFYENNFGLIKASVVDDLKDYLDIFKDPDMLIHAMKKAIDNNATFGYAKSIMQRWLNSKLMTLTDVKADELAFTNRTSNYKRNIHYKEIIPELIQGKPELEVNMPLDDHPILSGDLEQNELELRRRLNKLLEAS